MNQLYGLVLTGGKSERMKRDKASLELDGKKLSTRAFDLLKAHCDKVFLSVRDDQKNLEGRKGFPQILDQAPFLNIGPIGGILSAFTQFPDVAWLVLACDLPLVTDKTIEYLISYRNKEKIAVAYKSSHDQLPELLCAIYEPASFPLLKKHFESGQQCPRKFVINQKDVELLTLPDAHALDNINYPEEYSKVVQWDQKK